jgi:hypothetical protein
MHVVYDTISEEYGLLEREPVEKAVKDLGKKLNRKPLKTPKKAINLTIPVIKFFNENRKCCDTAFYGSENAQQRYEIIKEVDNLDQYFSFIDSIER